MFRVYWQPGTLIYSTTGSVVREILPNHNPTLSSTNFVPPINGDGFSQSHGYYGDTCDNDLGAVVWKEHEGINWCIS